MTAKPHPQIQTIVGRRGPHRQHMSAHRTPREIASQREVKTNETPRAIAFADQPFVGMWKGREDLPVDK